VPLALKTGIDLNLRVLLHKDHNMRLFRLTVLPAFVLLGLAVLLPCAPSSAATPAKMPAQKAATASQKATEEKFGDWLLVCQKQDAKTKLCFVAQEVQGTFQSGDKKNVMGRLARISLLPQKNKKEFLMVALLPLGINLQAGTAFSIDDAAQIQMPLQRCTNAGCEAIMEANDALLQKLKKGKSMKVGFNAGTKTLVVPLSLKGFDQAMSKLP
jgi:invasion protein IalB